MSYDLYFVPRAAGSDADAVNAFLEDADGKPTGPDETSHNGLAAALQEQHPALERFEPDFEEVARLHGVSVEEARRIHDLVELNASEKTGIQITLFPNQASITVPYWHTGSAAVSVFAKVRQYADVLTERGRFRIFDPQLEMVVDTFDDLRGALLEAYGRVVEQMPELTTQHQ